MNSKLFLPLTILLAAIIVFSGCRAKPEIIPAKTFVMDFKVSDEYVPGKTLHGWWFTSRDQRRDSNLGIAFSSILALRLKDLPEIDLYPSIDKHYYLQAKKKRLKLEYAELSDEQIDVLFERIDPIIFAKDRGCDVLVTGEIYDCYSTHNRMIHWWQGVVYGNVTFTNVETGEEIWSYTFKERDNFKTTLGMFDKMSQVIAKKIRKKKILR